MKSMLYKLPLSIGTILFSLATILLLLGSLPFTANYMSDSKLLFLSLTSILVFVSYLVVSFRKQAFEVSTGPYIVPTLLISFSSIASIFFTTPYPVEHLLGLGGVFLSFCGIVLFGDQLISRKAVPTILRVFVITATILSVLVGLEYVGLGMSNLIEMLPGISLAEGFIFNPTGSHLVGAIITGLALFATLFARAEVKMPKIAGLVMAVILLVGTGLQLYTLMPGQPGALVLPRAAASWSVALDSIRSPRQALIGGGPAAYANAYNNFKPSWVNATQTWNADFIQGRTLLFTLLTTTGFIGVISWIYLFIVIFRNARRSTGAERTLSLMAAAIVVVFLLFPAPTVLFGLLALLLSLSVAARGKSRNTLSINALSVKSHMGPHQKATQYLFGSIMLVLLLIAGAQLYMVGRAYAAYYYDFEAAKAVQANDAVQAYNLQQRAIQTNPYLDRLRRDYATTNLLIAIALSNKADATEAELAQVGQLIQQSIREGQAATVLDPADSRNWLALANTYQNMIGVAEDADQFAVQAYVSAIENSPANPLYRVQLALLFAGQEQYDQAINLLNQAVNLKPDLANAHYQLANILVTAQRPRQAEVVYQRLLTLLDSNSEEYTQVTAELEELQELIATLPEADDQSAQAQEAAGTTPSLLDQALPNPDENPDSISGSETQEDISADNIDLSGSQSETTPPSDSENSPE